MARKKSTLGPLAQEAIEFARARPRRNPPDPGDVDDLVQGFCVTKKSEGEDLSDYDEEEWREALMAIGVSEDDVASYLEDVASWGVDD